MEVLHTDRAPSGQTPFSFHKESESGGGVK